MMNRKNRLLAAVTVWCIFASCTVIEDRSSCPNMLRVHYDQCTLMGHYTIHSDMNTLYSGIIDPEHREMVSFRIHQNSVTYCAYFGLDDGDVVDDEYIIQQQEEVKEFYSFVSRDIPFNSMQSDLFVKPNKNFMRMSFNYPVIPSRTVFFVIESSTLGINLLTMEPIRGEYKSSKFIDTFDGTVSFLLLRQGFDDLKLTIMEQRGNNNIILGSYSLTSLLDDFGYDWNADSLLDIQVFIDGPRDTEIEFSFDIPSRITGRVCQENKRKYS